MLSTNQLRCIFLIYKGYYDFIDLMIRHQIEWAGTDFSLGEVERQLNFINESIFPYDKEPLHWVKDLDFEKFAYNYRLNIIKSKKKR